MRVGIEMGEMFPDHFLTALGRNLTNSQALWQTVPGSGLYEEAFSTISLLGLSLPCPLTLWMYIAPRGERENVRQAVSRRQCDNPLQKNCFHSPCSRRGKCFGLSLVHSSFCLHIILLYFPPLASIFFNES